MAENVFLANEELNRKMDYSLVPEYSDSNDPINPVIIDYIAKLYAAWPRRGQGVACTNSSVGEAMTVEFCVYLGDLARTDMTLNSYFTTIYGHCWQMSTMVADAMLDYDYSL